MKRKMPPPLATICLLSFGALDAWLGATIVASAVEPNDAYQLTTGALGNAREKKVPDVPATQIASLGRTLAVPAFFKSRAPYVPPPPPPVAGPPVAAAPVAPPPALSIAGIMIDKRTKKALLLTPVDTNGAWLTEGDQVMGWKIDTITSAGVTLRQNNAKIDFKMYPQP